MHVIGSLADILLKVRLLDSLILLDCCCLFGMFCTSSVAKIVSRSLTFVVYDLNLSHLENNRDVTVVLQEYRYEQLVNEKK